MKTVSAEEAERIEAAIKARGLKAVTRQHEKINWDEANQKYLPSDYTYSVSAQIEDAATGNAELVAISSVADVDALIVPGLIRLKKSAQRTRRAIADENRPT